MVAFVPRAFKESTPKLGQGKKSFYSPTLTYSLCFLYTGHPTEVPPTPRPLQSTLGSPVCLWCEAGLAAKRTPFLKEEREQ